MLFCPNNKKSKKEKIKIVNSHTVIDKIDNKLKDRPNKILFCKDEIYKFDKLTWKSFVIYSTLK